VPPAESILLETAREAKIRGDRAKVEWCLRGWASLGGGAPPPVTVSAEAALARAWAQGRPPFRVFGSRLADRIRVGLEDPAGLVGRVVVTIKEGDRELTLVPLEGSAPDRMEFGLDRPIHPETEVRIAALMTKLGGEALIREVVLLESKAALPMAPDLREKLAASSSTALARRAPAPSEPSGPLLPWWWIGAGVLACALAGAAIWQERR
jgi:hypothetical protein